VLYMRSYVYLYGLHVVDLRQLSLGRKPTYLAASELVAMEPEREAAAVWRLVPEIRRPLERPRWAR
jgi:hypothetical protein